VTIQGVLNRFVSSEHVFEMDAVPEPVPVESGDGDTEAVADANIVDDGFGPVADEDDYNDDDDDDGIRGGIIVVVIIIVNENLHLCDIKSRRQLQGYVTVKQITRAIMITRKPS